MPRLRGWYLRRYRAIAVGTGGASYILTVPASILTVPASILTVPASILTVPASLRAWAVGASPRPARPRLVIGQGGRDGGSAPLGMLPQRRLDAGDAWP